MLMVNRLPPVDRPSERRGRNNQERTRAAKAEASTVVREREHRAPPGGKGAASVRPLRKDHRSLERPPFECIALVLQGGGALGAFQGGVYQALMEAGLHPDWVAGISVGAINAALIAGNPPETPVDKPRAFREQVKTSPGHTLYDFAEPYIRGDKARGLMASCTPRTRIQGRSGVLHAADVAALPEFSGTIGRPATTTPPVEEHAGAARRLDRINSSATRFSVGAVNVRTGNFALFRLDQPPDQAPSTSWRAARSAGLPAVEIDGEHYWDGGLVSSLLQWVVGDGTRQDTLAFQVDLWSARGGVPNELAEALVRQRIYSSRVAPAPARTSSR